MPGNITPVNTWTTPLTGPAAGDPVNGGAGAPSFDMGQKLANRIEFLKERTHYTETDQTMQFPLIVLPQDANAWWQFGAVPAGPNGLLQTNVAGARVMWLDIELPKYGKLKELHLQLVGAPAHAGLPGTMPGIALYQQDMTSVAAATLLQSATDSSGTTGAYQQAHNIALTALNLTLDASQLIHYSLRVAGETGANSLVNLCVYGLYGLTSEV